MAHEGQVLELMQDLKVADDKIIGGVMSSLGFWAEGTSARNQSNRAMRELAGRGKLEKMTGYYRIPGCKSQYAEHSIRLTAALAEILKLPSKKNSTENIPVRTA